MRNNSVFILFILVALSLVMGGYEIVLYIKELEMSRSLYTIWHVVFLILVALWVSEDSKDSPGIYRPFDYGYLVFIFYIPYLPYYLVKTRGVAKGLSYLIGFYVLLNIVWLIQWPIYWVS